jgi:hypothetical protein
MRLKLTLAILFAATVPAMAQVQPACGVGQSCPAGSNQVPFPVVNPMQGLANVLNLPRNNNQPPPPTSANGLAPIATPPPVMPPGVNR